MVALDVGEIDLWFDDGLLKSQLGVSVLGEAIAILHFYYLPKGLIVKLLYTLLF